MLFAPGAMERFRGGRAVFLDRDGVIVEEVRYLHSPGDVAMIAGVVDAVRAFNLAGLAVVVVTNQAGIGRGYYGWEDFHAVQREIETAMAAGGARIDAVLACPFHPEAVVDAYCVSGHSHRKPAPGMILYAAQMMGLKLEGSWMVGDKLIDAEAASNAGLSGAFHVETGYGVREREKFPAEWPQGFKVVFVASIASVPARMGLEEGK